MEIAKDNCFDVRYNEYKDVLEVRNEKENIFRRHKFAISIISTSFIVIATYFALVYKFFAVLCTL